MGRLLTPQARLAQAARIRSRAKASASQEPPRREPEPGKRKEAVEVKDDDDEEEEDEKLRREEDQRAEQRARKKGTRGEGEPVIHDGPPKKKKYAVRLEEGFDVEKVIDRLLEGDNDIMTLKEILASAPRLRDELKGRLSRRLVPNIHLGTILPKEAEWAESGTKMDWKCVACATVDLVVKGSKYAAMVDTGAEMNIIREADAIRFRLDIDRSDCGPCHINKGNEGELIIGESEFLLPQERTLMVELMKRRHNAYAFSDEERGRLDVDKIPMIRIHTVPHEPWNMRGARYPNPDEEKKVVDYLDDKIRTHVADYSSGPYASPWFCFIKPTGTLRLVEDIRTIEEGPGHVERHEDLMGGMYLLVNTLLHESLDQSGSLNPAGNGDEVPESQDDEFEEGEIKEAFRVEEYDGIYMELGLLLSCEMRLRDASDRAQRMLQRYLVPDGHLFVRREVGNPRRVVCGRNRQIDVVAALHDGIAGGHRRIQATYAKISELYYWDGMMDMVGKFCRSCVPYQERSCLRQREPLHPRLEREIGVVVHVDLLFMSLGDRGYNYIFDARDNLSGFVDGRVIRTKTGSVLVSCIGEYYLHYPFVREFVMDRGSEFTCQEVQELLSRQRDPEPREARPSRGGRKALARREEEPEPEAEERGAYPECGLGPVEFHRFAEGGLRRSPVRTQGEPPASEEHLRKLEAHLDISQWRASPWGEEHGEPAKEAPREEVPREEVPREGMPREEVRDTQRERGLGDEGRRAGKEVIEVGEDTPPQTPATWRSQHLQSRARSHASPLKEMEAEIPKRVDLHMRERAPPGETAEEKRARRTRRIDEIWQERQRLEAVGELPEQQEERQRSEAAGALPCKPPSAPAKAPEIPEMWRDFWEQRGEELPSPVRAGFGVARKAEERLDRKIKFLAKATFDRHLLLESDLAGKKIKEAGHGVRLEAMEVEIQELRALVASQAAIIESLRQRSQGGADKPESSRQGEQRQPGHGLPGQPSVAETRQEPPMGRVILEPEEARAQREAEREAFEFRAPTELATLPIAAGGPVIPLAIKEGRPPSSSEPAQGSAKGSMDVLIEAVHSMQEEASLFSPEQRIKEPLEREMGIEAEGVIEGGLQRLGTPEYGSGGIEDRPGPSTQEVETREEPLDMPQSHELRREVSEAPSSPGSQRGKKRPRKWFDTSCFFCTKEGHRALQCPKFLKDKAEGKVKEEGGRMYDREGRRVERSADGGRAQLYRQNQEEMSDQD
ncbi:hypothetical protein CBR_g20036 [Chara braunii]|uniref:CCHC-type domain-containing protein n=1 Tax=Chara braunii TaxID=69332 RepID=A0A388KZC7_CHABU|nr:hypothetical protein CBR_g20036 [Chara braunii]|eukprot:GBG75406.1 hypothetical protein CBR_g20036 [Chara braunii]